MNKFFIKEYINKLTKIDIYSYANNKDINLNKYELDTIYDYIKNNTDDIFNNPDKILLELKNNLRKDNYKKIYNLYLEYKNKIS